MTRPWISEHVPSTSAVQDPSARRSTSRDTPADFTAPRRGTATRDEPTPAHVRRARSFERVAFAAMSYRKRGTGRTSLALFSILDRRASRAPTDARPCQAPARIGGSIGTTGCVARPRGSADRHARVTRTAPESEQRGGHEADAGRPFGAHAGGAARTHLIQCRAGPRDGRRSRRGVSARQPHIRRIDATP